MTRNMKQWLEDLKASPVKKALPILSFPSAALIGCNVKEITSNSDLQAEGMKLVADYNDLHTSLSGNVMLRFASTPAGTIRCEAAPIAVKLQEVTR